MASPGSSQATQSQPPPSPTDGFQFSLGKMLLVFFFLALLITAFRWMLLNAPQMLIQFIMIASAMLPFLAAIVTLFAVSRHSPTPRKLQVWATILMLSPMVGMGLAAFLANLRLSRTPAAALATGPTALKSMTTADILTQRLPNQLHEPWVWNELRDRIDTGDLTTEEAQQAAQLIVTDLSTSGKRGGVTARSGLTWSKQFLQRATANQLLTQKDIFALNDAYYGKATVNIPRLRENSETMHVNVQYGSHQELEFAGVLLWEPSFELDGKPLELKVQNHHRSGYTGLYRESLAAGNHEVEAVVHCVLVDKEKMVGLNRHRLPRSSWPKPIRAWQQKIKVPFKVFKSDEPIIELVKDAPSSPKQHLRFERFVVQPYTSRGDKTTTKKAIVHFAGTESPIAFGFKVYAVRGDEEHKVGTIVGYKTPQGGWGTRLKTEGYLKDLNPDFRTADLILRPDAKLLEFESRADKMWGKSLKFPNVPIERLDLESTATESAN